MNKSALRCKTPSKAQVNFRKKQRVLMNRKHRHIGKCKYLINEEEN